MNHENDPPLQGECEEGRHHDHHDTHGEHGHHHHGGQEHEHHHHGPWKLNVQGVVIESPHPEIVVRQAIKQAGFNPDTPWIIVLKVAGEPKREVDLSFVIDLRHKGIEKLRLTPKQINNGEVAPGGASNLPSCRKTRDTSIISGCAGRPWSMWGGAGLSFATTPFRLATVLL